MEYDIKEYIGTINTLLNCRSNKLIAGLTQEGTNALENLEKIGPSLQEFLQTFDSSDQKVTEKSTTASKTERATQTVISGSGRITDVADVGNVYQKVKGEPVQPKGPPKEVQYKDLDNYLPDTMKPRIQKTLDKRTKVENEIEEIRAQLDDETKALYDLIIDEIKEKQGQLEQIDIAEEYVHICTDVWPKAKAEIDLTKSGCIDEKKTYLCDVFMISDKKAKEVYVSLERKLVDILTEPVKFVAGSPASRNTSEVKVKPDLKEVNSYLKSNTELIVIQHLVEMIEKDLKDVHFSLDITITPAVSTYIEKCARLAWKMKLNKPQLFFDNKSGLKEKSESVECDSDKSVVEYFVYPTLRTDDATLVPGSVLTMQYQNVECCIS